MSPYTIISRSERATAYKLQHNREKLAIYKNHLTFLVRCQKNGVIPKGLEVWMPITSPGSQRIANRTNKAILKEAIIEVRPKRRRIQQDIDQITMCLNNNITYTQWNELDRFCKKRESQVVSTTKERQKRKFGHLKKKQTSEHTLDRSKTVVNLSQRPLTPSEEDILLLGLNYAVAPSKLRYHCSNWNNC